MAQLLSVDGALYLLLDDDDSIVVMHESSGRAIQVGFTEDKHAVTVEGWRISRKLPEGAHQVEVGGKMLDVMYDLVAIIPTWEEDRCPVPDGELLYGD